MDVSAAREALLGAVRRDLFGPTGVDDPPWPGSEPIIVGTEGRPAHRFAEWRDTRNAMIDADGNEVLRSNPLRRYGIGILFPRMSATVRADLDASQDDAVVDGTGSDSNLVEDSTQAQATPPDSTPAHDDDEPPVPHRQSARPETMAMSFVVDRALGQLDVTVCGGRYTPLEVAVHETDQQFWRRVAVTENVALAITGDQKSIRLGLVRLEVGVRARAHEAGTIVTVYLRNAGTTSDLKQCAESALFQASLRVSLAKDDLLDYPTSGAGRDAGLDLLYHRQPVRVVGHGCSARWRAHDDGRVDVYGEHLPVETVRSPEPDVLDANGQRIAVDMDGLAADDPEAVAQLEAILDGYADWIQDRRVDTASLRAQFQEVAGRHLDACETFLASARSGWAKVRSDATVGRIFRLTSSAMAAQRRAYAARTRPWTVSGKSVTFPDPSPHVRTPTAARWRGFQLAMLLASIESIFSPADDARDEVDLIWLPTGGGKTEAYSAVAAFTILWRRLNLVQTGQRDGTAVIMRYTLRLLTAQQLQRAASLICALERIRLDDVETFGKQSFTIGAWLGQASTPNNRESALRGYRDWEKDANERCFLLSRCPWCAAEIGRLPGAGDQQIIGYSKQQSAAKGQAPVKRVKAHCPDSSCPFHDKLPVYEVDEDLYGQPPTFVVATVDKFAMLSWRPDPAKFFGLEAGGRTRPGPDLLIQDELHLISGPLGSLDALYEPMIEDLCQRDGGRRPRIVCATATIRRYTEQVAALYGRKHTRLIPPPGLDARDSYFASVRPDSVGKQYVAIYAPGFGKTQETQIRLLAALAHAAGSLAAANIPADPWWTNLCFFNSRRILGHVHSLCQTHLRGHTWRLHETTGVASGPMLAGRETRLAQRACTRRVELTAQATTDVTASMDRLGIPLTEPDAVDLCFATSMIEVGVDIDRLGLLTMFGQPKSASQYIQVAGRVGRSPQAPGIVFVCLSPYSARDVSHFEQFSAFHERLYASVEPVSITPYTPSSLRRGLAGALTSWIRQASPGTEPPGVPNTIDAAAAPLLDRISRCGWPDVAMRQQLAVLREAAELTTATEWGSLRPGRRADGFLGVLGTENRSDNDPDAQVQWFVPTSMRSVDAESGARNITHAGSTKKASRSAATPAEDEGDEY